MTLFLTSSPGGIRRTEDGIAPCPIDNSNGIVEQLKARWKPDGALLFITAFPDGHEMNDQNTEMLAEAFRQSGLSIARTAVWDDRTEKMDLSQFDMIVQGGGHVPTQNAFFQKIGLKDALTDFDGILLGISAGTMNCASTVYAQPELPGETTAPDYRRFIPGLGLTDIMVLPHYNSLKDETLDGQRIIEDITFGDSYGHSFILLVDGSHILVENGLSTLCGEGYRVQDGTLAQICEMGKTITL